MMVQMFENICTLPRYEGEEGQKLKKLAGGSEHAGRAAVNHRAMTSYRDSSNDRLCTLLIFISDDRSISAA